MAQEAEELGPPVLQPVGNDRQLDIEQKWLAEMVEVSDITLHEEKGERRGRNTGWSRSIEGAAAFLQAWQNDEWQVQANHRDLGIAVGKVGVQWLLSTPLSHS